MRLFYLGTVSGMSLLLASPALAQMEASDPVPTLRGDDLLEPRGLGERSERAGGSYSSVPLDQAPLELDWQALQGIYPTPFPLRIPNLH
jgi:hypothetical protein